MTDPVSPCSPSGAAPAENGHTYEGCCEKCWQEAATLYAGGQGAYESHTDAYREVLKRVDAHGPPPVQIPTLAEFEGLLEDFESAVADIHRGAEAPMDELKAELKGAKAALRSWATRALAAPPTDKEANRG